MRRFFIFLSIIPALVWGQDSLNVRRLSSIPTTCVAVDVGVTGDYALVCSEECGVQTSNVSNPFAPFRVDNGFGYAWGAEGIAIEGNIACVASGWQGLFIANIANPEFPAMLDTIAGPENNESCDALGVAISGDYAYVAFEDSGVWVVDISDPVHATLVGTFDTPGKAYDVTIVDDFAYVSDWYGGMRILDISDPANLVEVGFFDTPGATHDIVIVDNLALLADGGGMRIVDVTDPTQPVELAFVATSYPCYAVDAKDGFAFVGFQGLRVLDVTSPTAPVEVGYYRSDRVGTIIGLHVYGDRVFTANWGDTEYANCSILDVSHFLPAVTIEPPLPTQFSLHPIYPNPFNNTANISFDLPREVTGRLVVYDVLGRMTNTLYNGKLAAGTHSMQFNGNNLSTGVYFVKLETPDFNAVQKAVLLK